MNIDEAALKAEQAHEMWVAIRAAMSNREAGGS